MQLTRESVIMRVVFLLPTHFYLSNMSNGSKPKAFLKGLVLFGKVCHWFASFSIWEKRKEGKNEGMNEEGREMKETEERKKKERGHRKKEKASKHLVTRNGMLELQLQRRSVVTQALSAKALYLNLPNSIHTKKVVFKQAN